MSYSALRRAGSQSSGVAMCSGIYFSPSWHRLFLIVLIYNFLFFLYLHLSFAVLPSKSHAAPPPTPTPISMIERYHYLTPVTDLVVLRSERLVTICFAGQKLKLLFSIVTSRTQLRYQRLIQEKRLLSVPDPTLTYVGIQLLISEWTVSSLFTSCRIVPSSLFAPAEFLLILMIRDTMRGVNCLFCVENVRWLRFYP